MIAGHVDDLLRSHHVDLVLAGHDHIYERGDAGGLKYVITGGGGAPLYRDNTVLPSTRKLEATYHYVLTTLTDDALSIVARRADGSLLEECSAGHTGSWRCDPPPPAPAVASGAPPTNAAPEHSSGCACALAVRDDATRFGGLSCSIVAFAMLLGRRGRRSG
jgi:hypothetical protein